MSPTAFQLQSHFFLAAAVDASERAHTPTPQAIAIDARDRQWLSELASDELSALQAFMDNYTGKLVHFAQSFTHSTESANEVVQDVFVWLWDHRSTLNVDGSVASYLYRAVRNRALNYVRRERAQQRIVETVAEEWNSRVHHAESPDLDMEDIRAEAAAILQVVPARCREIFLLIWGHEMTYEEVANVLGVGQRTVQNQYYRAVAALARHFEALGRKIAG